MKPLMQLQAIHNKLCFGGIAQNASSRGSTFARLRGGNMNATYDRLFFFAELNMPGKCFMILNETVNKSDLLVSYAQHSVGIGDIFAILKPDQVAHLLQGDLPLISNTSKALYLLLNSGFASKGPLVVRRLGSNATSISRRSRSGIQQG
jgi:hypothetical protein